MDAHIWPSLYPAIVVGLFVSLSFGGISILRCLIGALAGLAGGAAAYFVLLALNLNSGPIGSIGMLATSAVFAWLVLKFTDQLRGGPSVSKDETQ